MPEVQVLAGFSFKIEVGGQVIAEFKEVSGLETAVEVITHEIVTQEGRHMIRKVPGRRLTGDITCKRGLSADKQWWDWLGKIDTGMPERLDGSIVIYDNAGGEQARFNFMQAWPSRVSISGLSASSNDVLMEEVVLTHEGIEMPGTT